MTEPESLAFARKGVDQEGWPFLEPVSVVHPRRWFGRGGVWTVHTHRGAMNGQVGIMIDDRTVA